VALLAFFCFSLTAFSQQVPDAELKKSTLCTKCFRIGTMAGAQNIWIQPQPVRETEVTSRPTLWFPSKRCTTGAAWIGKFKISILHG